MFICSKHSYFGLCEIFLIKTLYVVYINIILRINVPLTLKKYTAYVSIYIHLYLYTYLCMYFMHSVLYAFLVVQSLYNSCIKYYDKNKRVFNFKHTCSIRIWVYFYIYVYV